MAKSKQIITVKLSYSLMCISLMTSGKPVLRIITNHPLRRTAVSAFVGLPTKSLNLGYTRNDKKVNIKTVRLIYPFILKNAISSLLKSSDFIRVCS